MDLEQFVELDDDSAETSNIAEMSAAAAAPSQPDNLAGAARLIRDACLQLVAEHGIDSSEEEEEEQPAEGEEEEEEVTEVSRWDQSRDNADCVPLDLKLTNQASHRERDGRFNSDITIRPWKPQHAPVNSAAAASPPAAAAGGAAAAGAVCDTPKPDGNCPICQEPVVSGDASQWNHCMCTAWYHTACMEDIQSKWGDYGVHKCPCCSITAVCIFPLQSTHDTEWRRISRHLDHVFDFLRAVYAEPSFVWTPQEFDGHASKVLAETYRKYVIGDIVQDLLDMQADLLGAAPVEVHPIHVKDLHYDISECVHSWRAMTDGYLGSLVSARQLETPATPPPSSSQVAPSFASNYIWSMAILSATGKSGWAAVHTSQGVRRFTRHRAVRSGRYGKTNPVRIAQMAFTLVLRQRLRAGIYREPSLNHTKKLLARIAAACGAKQMS
jgi:hypothetical protein